MTPDRIPVDSAEARELRDAATERADAPHVCDRGWVELTDGRLRRCDQCRTDPLRLTEKQWQQRVVGFARLHRWRTFHALDSRGSTPGWPDLAMVRRGRFVLAELKTATGRVSPAQQDWLTDLAACPGAEVHLWRPSDWPRVQETLR